MVRLRDDDSLLDAGSVLAFEQGRPQVSLDRVVALVGRVVPDVKVGPVLPRLVFNNVNGNLEHNAMQNVGWYNDMMV